MPRILTSLRRRRDDGALSTAISPRFVSHLILFGIGLVVGRLWESQTPGMYLDPGISKAMEDQSSSRTQSSTRNDDGWKTMELFVGSKPPPRAPQLMKNSEPPQKWFAQCRQDEVVLKLLNNKRNGYFVDLAANDATILSNTYALEQQAGWTGLCIEPNPMYWYNLTSQRKCQVVSAIVGAERDQAIGFEYALGDHGGITGQRFNNKKIKSRNAYTVPLDEIFQRMNVPKQIDYFSLDVEGAEEFILQAFDLSQYDVSIWTIERPSEAVRTILESHRYKNILRISRWGESLWVHERLVPGINMTELEEEYSGKAQWDKFKREKEAAEAAEAAAKASTR